MTVQASQEQASDGVSPTPETLVDFFDLVGREDGDEMIVGRSDTGDFVVLPTVGWQIIESLRAGRSVESLVRQFDEDGVDLDVPDVVDQLSSLGFVRSVGGTAVTSAPPERAPSLPWLQARHVHFLTHPLVGVVWLAVVAAGVLTLITTPRVRPNFRDLLFSDSTSLVLLGTTAMFLLVVALHEAAHLVSARASGVPARISLGTRLYSLVAQTDVSGLWASSRRERIRTYLAGMAFDLFFIAVLLLFRAHVLSGTLDALATALVVLLGVGIAGQFQLFMRTDVYFLAAEVLRARNLFEDATVLVIHTIRRAVGKAQPQHPLSSLPGRERKVISWYAVFMVLGTVVALSAFAFFILPALVLLLIRGAERLAMGIDQGNWALAADGALTLLIEGGTQVLVLVLLIRSRRAWVSSLRGRLSGGDER